MKGRLKKERVEETVLDEYSNQHLWSKTSCAVQQGIVQIGLLGDNFPEYDLMDVCFPDNTDVFLQGMFLRDASVETNTKLKMLRSKFLYSSRIFELKKDVQLTYELPLLISEIVKNHRQRNVFYNGQLFESPKDTETFYGILKGRTTYGKVHLRPLLSEADLRIGIYELLEPAVFEKAVIVQAYSDESLFVREEGLYFRFKYHYQRPLSWDMLR
jgi:hypothetical protein